MTILSFNCKKITCVKSEYFNVVYFLFERNNDTILTVTYYIIMMAISITK